MTKAAYRDSDATVQKKYVGNVTDGPVTIPDNDAVANHEEFWQRILEDTQSVADREAGLKRLDDVALRNLAVRQRNRLAGTHEAPQVNQESRQLGSNDVSLLAGIRLLVAEAYPKLKTTSAEYNRIVAETLRRVNEIHGE
jgi:hypothetical protein